MYRGADPDPAKTDFYGLLLGNETPKKTALAFSLWAKIAECRQRLSIAPSGGGVAPYVLAGHAADGEIHLLIAIASDRPARWRVKIGQGKEIAELPFDEVSEASDRVRTLRVMGAHASIAPDSVQLLRVIQN